MEQEYKETLEELADYFDEAIDEEYVKAFIMENDISMYQVEDLKSEEHDMLVIVDTEEVSIYTTTRENKPTMSDMLEVLLRKLRGAGVVPLDTNVIVTTAIVHSKKEVTLSDPVALSTNYREYITEVGSLKNYLGASLTYDIVLGEFAIELFAKDGAYTVTSVYPDRKEPLDPHIEIWNDNQYIKDL